MIYDLLLKANDNLTWIDSFPCVFVLSVPLPAVENMDVSDETFNSMTVKWDKVDDATGYMLLYRSKDDPEQEKEVELLFSPPWWGVCFHL